MGSPLPFVEKLNTNTATKKKLAAEAVKEIQDGDVIFIDSGTTTCFIVDYIPINANVTVITHSIEVINRALLNPGITIICLNGSIHRKSFAISCSDPQNQLSAYNINKAFMTADGLTVRNGATQYSITEYETKRAVIQRSSYIAMLAESQKFNFASLYTYCEIDDIDEIITDVMPSRDFISAFSSHGGKIIIPD